MLLRGCHELSQTHNTLPLLLFHVGTKWHGRLEPGPQSGKTQNPERTSKCGVGVQVIVPSVFPLREEDEAKNRCIKKSTSGSVAGAVMRVLVYDKWTYFILSVSGRNGIHLPRRGKGIFGSGLAAVVRWALNRRTWQVGSKVAIAAK